MATLTVHRSSPAGVVFSPASAAGGGDQFPNDGETILHVANGGGAPVTVTITPQNTLPGGLSLANVGGSVTNGTAKTFGPFPAEYFNNSSGRAVVTYSDVTSVTVLPISSKRG